jgi:hypothetical protein
VLSKKPFDDGKGDYNMGTCPTTMNSTRDILHQVTLVSNVDNFYLALQSAQTRTMEVGGIGTCGDYITLRLQVSGKVKPGKYPVTALLRVDTGEKRGKSELAFNIIVSESE